MKLEEMEKKMCHKSMSRKYSNYCVGINCMACFNVEETPKEHGWYCRDLIP